MKVSIIIVSYNVKYFLEQCLCSVRKALGEWSMVNSESRTELIVVDNNSSDGSVESLAARFPFVQFISNTENAGFSKANNQGLVISKGEYILFLNPDTVIPEDFFLECIPFLEKEPGVGAVGVQMIDAQGCFLKESKRGFPTLWASFSRLSGLTALFPRSSFFSKYYLGHLNKDKNQRVEVLSGACMLVKREVLDKTGGFDERFFMYAEDIDLSFRIHQAGYRNFYLADPTIIHFKGESTIKDLRYVKLFYKAMIQFVQKHYTGTWHGLYTKFLEIAIGLRGFLAFGSLQVTRKSGKTRIEKPGTFFMGDDTSIQEIKILNLLPVAIVQKRDEASEIILCEGNDFTFRKLIETMKRSPGKNYNIHAWGSSGVAGNLRKYEW